tara:strand:+ start:596 stop:1072 length:477 start_codon:yes stop_codon:yes gene_type:complete
MSNNLASSTLMFLFDNIFAIFFIVVLFSVVTIYIIIHDISFKEKTYTVNKVITIEKFTPSQIKKKAGEDMRNDKSCKKLKYKDSCIALGNCVWVTAKPNKKNIEKCVSANPNIDTTAPGSDGPEKKCFKHKKKLIPWENYYYLDGKTTKEKKINISMC